jgi:hypothetical protein
MSIKSLKKENDTITTIRVRKITKKALRAFEINSSESDEEILKRLMKENK